MVLTSIPDLSDHETYPAESVCAYFRTVYEKYGRIAVLVNCASYGAGKDGVAQLTRYAAGWTAW